MVASAAAQLSSRAAILRVLIVDDDRDNRLTLGVLLRSEGYLVSLADDGQEGLRLAAAYRPDVVILDLFMPGESGFEIAEAMRRDYGNGCPILIAISAHGTAQAEQHAKASGFHHFVAKPYDPAALLRLVESLDEATS